MSRQLGGLFVRKIDSPVVAASKVLGSSPYVNDPVGFGLRYINRIGYFRGYEVRSLVPNRKMNVPFYQEESQFHAAEQKEYRKSRGKFPTKKFAGKKKKK